MRYFGRTLARRPGVGATLLVALAALGMAGCSAEFWKGRPDVDRVEVTVSPRIIAEHQQAQANGVPKKGDGSAIRASKVRVSYSSSNPAVATVSTESGVIVGVSPGKAAITAEAQGKTATDTIQVVQADPTSIVVTPEVVAPTTGETVTITLDPRGPNGQTLPNRRATFTSADSRIAQVTATGPLTAAVTGLIAGNTTILATIGSATRQIAVSVKPPRVTRVDAILQNGTSSLQVTENQQIQLTLRDPNNAITPTSGHLIVYQSSDVTVAAVNGVTGVVTGLKVGTADITITVDNDPVTAKTLRVTVVPQKVEQLLFPLESFQFRIGGVPRNLAATPVDSNGRVIVTRTPSYQSTNSAVATVSAVGIVTPRALGTTNIIATLDNLADTLVVRVTQIPVGQVVLEPLQATATPGETRQFTATVYDSLGVQVTDRSITWQTDNPSVATVDQNGLATASAPGSTQIQAFVARVPGFGDRIGGVAQLIIRLTPIARIDVNPTSVSIKAGTSTAVALRVLDANGRELFGRNSSIAPVSADPSIAQANQAGTITGIKVGTTTITFQAVDAAGIAQGTPAVVTVTVTAP